MLVLDVDSQETRTSEAAPRTYSLLRPSAFSVPVTTSAGVLFTDNDRLCGDHLSALCSDVQLLHEFYIYMYYIRC